MDADRPRTKNLSAPDETLTRALGSATTVRIGEVELVPGGIRGLAVHETARIMPSVRPTTSWSPARPAN